MALAGPVPQAEQRGEREDQVRPWLGGGIRARAGGLAAVRPSAARPSAAWVAAAWVAVAWVAAAWVAVARVTAGIRAWAVPWTAAVAIIVGWAAGRIRDRGGLGLARGGVGAGLGACVRDAGLWR